MKRIMLTITLLVVIASIVNVHATDDEPKKDPKDMTVEERFDLLKTLESRMNELKMKKLEIQKATDELEIQRKQIEERVTYLESMKKELGDKLDKKMEKDVDALLEITKVYEEMSPKKAAKIIESLDIDMARIVIKVMNKKKAAQVLDKISDEKAIKISEYYAGFSPDAKNQTMDSVRRSGMMKPKEGESQKNGAQPAQP